MVYSYSFVDIAQEEYEDAINWYADRSLVAAGGFVDAVDHALTLICDSPSRWRNVYKDYYELALKKYPYSIVYNINDTINLVVVNSIYHHSRNPKRKYRK